MNTRPRVRDEISVLLVATSRAPLLTAQVATPSGLNFLMECTAARTGAVLVSACGLIRC